MRNARLLVVAVTVLVMLALVACQPIQVPEEMMGDAGDSTAAAATETPAEEGEDAAADDAAAQEAATEEVVLDESMAIATIATRSLRVRQEPSEDAEVVFGVSEGERYNVLEISPDGGWVRLALPGAPEGSGWVSAGLVSVEGELSGAAGEAPTEETPAPAEEAAAEATAAPAEEAAAEETPAPAEEAAAEATAVPAEEAAAEATPAPAEETAAEATPAPAEEELAPPAAGFVQIFTDGTRLRVRSEPNTDAEIVGYVYNGEEYELLGQSEDGAWVQIAGSSAAETDNPDGGWVAAEFVIIGQ